ncbi:MAG TPA: GNAT family N-acetyltransferase [Anaerolineae bacterium]|nr:GNAT family N-acetyltransferase [Anaerolineae bacterium]
MSSEVWSQLEHYRYVKSLPSGERLLLRPLTHEDKQNLVDLFARASKEDLEYFREDAGDPKVVERWVDNLNLKRVFPLVAVVDGKIVGDATLHFGERYHRHLAWVRIFLDRQYRRQGIGTLMLRNLTKIARLLGLQQLYAEVPTTQPQVIKAFVDQGYQQEFVLRDYFITGEGETFDMAILVLRLVEHSGEF